MTAPFRGRVNITTADGRSNGVDALSVEGLTVAYDDHLALNGVTLTARSGDIVGVVGANGAGKTTFVRALIGKAAVTSGAVRLDGALVTPATAPHRAIAISPQRAGVYSYLTVRENIAALARTTARGPVAASEIDAVIAAVGLADKAHVRAAALSGGMAQRLSAAIALAARPRLLILDEPAAGVDADARELLGAVLRDFAGTGGVAVLVTHELEDAERLCNRVAVLSRGRCVAYAAPERLIAEHFGAKKELIAHGPAQPALIALLEGAGFAHHDDGAWRALSVMDVDAAERVAALMRQLVTHGASLTIRPPSLRSVVARINAEAA